MSCKLLVLMVVVVVAMVTGGDASRIKPRGGKNYPTQKSAKRTQLRNFARPSRAVDPSGIDFTNAVFDEETGKRCIVKEESVTSLEKAPILECTHKEIEKCHYSYITQFSPAQEEVCEENFEKTCQITFKQQAMNETVRKCYRPSQKVCNGQGEEVCQTVYESSCTTKYVEKQPGKFVGDTSCEKLPVEICGAGCTFEEGPEECHDKVIASLLDVPEEICDLNPQKTCKLQTKLVPKLTPQHQCTLIPQEVCNLKFTTPKQVTRPLLTKWCLDDSPVVPGESYDESNALGSPLRESARTQDLDLENPQLIAKPISLITDLEDTLEEEEEFLTQKFEDFVDFSNF